MATKLDLSPYCTWLDRVQKQVVGVSNWSYEEESDRKMEKMRRNCPSQNIRKSKPMRMQ